LHNLFMRNPLKFHPHPPTSIEKSLVRLPLTRAECLIQDVVTAGFPPPHFFAFQMGDIPWELIPKNGEKMSCYFP
jgi:hypothetical protein